MLKIKGRENSMCKGLETSLKLEFSRNNKVMSSMDEAESSKRERGMSLRFAQNPEGLLAFIHEYYAKPGAVGQFE